MKIVILHGSPRKGITYALTEQAKRVLTEQHNAEFTEFFFHKDSPVFCKGCFNCIYKGEDKCPDAQYIAPIVQAMREADAWIVTTCIYSLQLTAGLKAFLDHTSYKYVTHRPEYFRKKVMLLAVSAGAGTTGTLKYLKKNFTYWLLNRVYTVGIASMAASVSGIPEKRWAKLSAKVEGVAQRFGDDVASGVLHRPKMIQVIMFRAIERMLQGFEETNIDRVFWQQKGYLNKGVSYIPDAGKPNLFQRAVQGIVAALMRLMPQG